MIYVDNDLLLEKLSWKGLIPGIKEAFKNEYSVPTRHHHQYKHHEANEDSTMLLMPAWDNSQYFGLKVVNVSPDNSRYNLSTIQGVYLLFETKTGVPIASMDARLLTKKRTAATSALASSMLSRVDSHTLLMIGTGELAPELIKAHCYVRPIQKVLVWGRSFKKAESIANQFEGVNHFNIQAIESISEGIKQADIVSAATLSSEPLIIGSECKPGQHIDLVGSYLPTMRESDSDLISRAKVFVDTYQGALSESGDLIIPIQEGIIAKEHIVAELPELCQFDQPWRKNDHDITCFKSVGHAIEDLAAAVLAYQSV